MAQIARSSDVLIGQIYRDFAGKDDIIAAIVERDISEWLDDPQLAAAIEAGEPAQIDAWVTRFMRRCLDDESRNLMADILSEATRNPRCAAIIRQAYDRLRERLLSAARVWLPDPDQEPDRMAIVDFILTLTGALQHRQLMGLACDEILTEKMVELVEAQIALRR